MPWILRRAPRWVDDRFSSNNGGRSFPFHVFCGVQVLMRGLLEPTTSTSSSILFFFFLLFIGFFCTCCVFHYDFEA